MKKLFYLGSILLMTACAAPQQEQKTFIAEGNPIITDKFTADPAPLVHDGTLYLYVGQDSASGGKEFNITEWLCYSTKDMKT